MGFLDFIKNKLFKRRESLPEAQNAFQVESSNARSVGNVTTENLDNFVKVDYTPKIETFSPNPGTIDFALQQYIFGLQFQYQNGKPFNSYSALTGLCGMDTSVQGYNAQNEMKFLNRLANDGKVNLVNQYAADKSVCFRHVQHGRDAGNTNTRLYVNCKRENIAELADKFYEEFGDRPYYFKFCSDSQASRNRRSEQFVFYLSSEPHELNEVIQTIERTRQKNPRLFEGSKNMNPFMKEINGYIGFAPDVKVDEFQTIKGGKKPITARSYNTLLSESLTDCFTDAIRDVVSRDYDLSVMMGGQYYDSAQPYIGTVLGKICDSPEHQKKLIEKMKSNLKISSQKNSLLSIKGIELDRNVEQGRV